MTDPKEFPQLIPLYGGCHELQPHQMLEDMIE